MQIFFSYNNTIASKLIRKVTGEGVSHCGIRAGEWMIHSNFLGLQVEHVTKFLSKGNVVGMVVEIPDNYQRLLSLVFKFQRSKYDVMALLFLYLRIFLRRWGFPVAKVNLWQVSGMFLCTEWVTKYIDGEEDSLITPYQLYLRLGKKEK